MKAYLYKQKNNKYISEISLEKNMTLSKKHHCDCYVLPLFCTTIKPNNQTQNIKFDTTKKRWINK